MSAKDSEASTVLAGSEPLNTDGSSTFPCIDYVLVYDEDKQAEKTKKMRQAFEKAMENNQLMLEHQKVDDKVFVKIFCPFERLAVEAELVKVEMPLSGCEILQEPTCTTALCNVLTTDTEVDFVSGSFQTEKLHLFEGHENPLTFFRSSLRSHLVHNILINLTWDDKPDNAHDPANKQGLLHMLMKGVYKDSFILHTVSLDDPYYKKMKELLPTQYDIVAQAIRGYTDPRKELDQTWTRFWKFQPLWRVRNYFGEKIAFYFAWQGTLITLLWIPAIFGFCSFLYGLYERTTVLAKDIFGVIRKSFNNELNPYFSLFICIWGSVFLEVWKRRNSTLAYEWDVNNLADTEPDRPEFYGTVLRTDPITKEKIWAYPEYRRLKQFLISAVIILIMMFGVILSIVGVITFKTWIRLELDCPRDGSDQDDDDDDYCEELTTGHPAACLIVGSLIPALANAALVLLWETLYRHVASRLTDWENHQTQSDYNDALVIKWFAFQFVNSYAILFYIAFMRPAYHPFQDNGLFGLGEKYKDTCGRGSCMSLLALQVLLLMIIKPVMKLMHDIAIPWSMKKFKHLRRFLVNHLCRSRKGKVHSPEAEKRRQSVISEKFRTPGGYLLHECKKPPVGDFSLEEFSEKVIQFGYVVMFAAAFPLAPVIALVVNLFDLRIDARRLLWFNRRPIAFFASNIGMWAPLLRFVNFSGIVTNAFLVASATDLTKQYTNEQRYLSLISFEHILFVLIFLVDIVIPDVPAHIRQAMRRERYQVAKVLEKGFFPGSNMGSIRESRVPSRAASYRSLVEGHDVNASINALRQYQIMQQVQTALCDTDLERTLAPVIEPLPQRHVALAHTASSASTAHLVMPYVNDNVWTTQASLTNQSQKRHTN